MSNNPLQGYTRPFTHYVSLPSRCKYYEEDEVITSYTGEVKVRAMSSRDELILQNPDALFSGDAIVQVIKSCAPAIKEPSKMLTNDLEALFMAIKAASGDGNIEIKDHKCPKCDFLNGYTLPITNMLESIEFLEEEYSVSINQDIEVFVKPYDFESFTKLSLLSFKQQKIIESIDLEEDDHEAAILQKKEIFESIVALTEDLLINSVVKVRIIPEGKDVVDREHIREFVLGLDSRDADTVNTLIQDINKIGIKQMFVAECTSETCDHTWEIENFQLNPADFFV